jgi:NAD+ kinase
VIEDYFLGRFTAETRSMICTRVVRDGETLPGRPVLNDAVLVKGLAARMMEFRVQIDGGDAAHLRADGLIVATPTGSTAYSLSAGGPILHPALDALVISAICPHSLTLRPIVVPGHLHVAITLVQAEDAHLTLDGQVEHGLFAGDRVEFQKSEQTVTLLQDANFSFFRLLQEKLHWSDR